MPIATPKQRMIRPIPASIASSGLGVSLGGNGFGSNRACSNLAMKAARREVMLPTLARLPCWLDLHRDGPEVSATRAIFILRRDSARRTTYDVNTKVGQSDWRNLV